MSLCIITLVTYNSNTLKIRLTSAFNFITIVDMDLFKSVHINTTNLNHI